MPLQIEWLVEDKVVFAQLSGHFSIDEAKTMVLTGDNMTKESEAALIHTLIDVRKLETYPKNIVQTRNLIQSTVTKKHFGWIVTYGHIDPLLRFFSSMVFNIFKVRVRSFETREDAIKFLKSVDKTLPTDMI